MTDVPAAKLAEAFVEIADTLVDEFDLVTFLQLVATRSTEITGATAAGLLLADRQGRLRFMAASDERSRLLELFQVQIGEGPCRDCFHTGQPVVNSRLDAAGDRWPRFAPRAVAAGFRSVHAFPLRLRKEVIGALGLFGTGMDTMSPSNLRVVQALADIATIGLLQERAIQRGEVLAEQLQGALNSRVVIEQAKGAIAQIHGVTIDEAFEILRAYCRRNRLHLRDVASAVIADPAALPALPPSARS
jgi:transcriptional regulator with GAF, ATPase, and Fis domain